MQPFGKDLTETLSVDSFILDRPLSLIYSEPLLKLFDQIDKTPFTQYGASYYLTDALLCKALAEHLTENKELLEDMRDSSNPPKNVQLARLLNANVLNLENLEETINITENNDANHGYYVYFTDPVTGVETSFETDIISYDKIETIIDLINRTSKKLKKCYHRCPFWHLVDYTLPGKERKTTPAYQKQFIKKDYTVEIDTNNKTLNKEVFDYATKLFNGRLRTQHQLLQNFDTPCGRLQDTTTGWMIQKDILDLKPLIKKVSLQPLNDNLYTASILDPWFDIKYTVTIHKKYLKYANIDIDKFNNNEDLQDKICAIFNLILSPNDNWI